jgi:hypothetical protein
MKREEKFCGVIESSGAGYWVERTGIHGQYPGGLAENLIIDLPIDRVSIFVDDKYVGIVQITPDSGFFFSGTAVNYEYYVDGKNLQLYFNKDKL